MAPFGYKVLDATVYDTTGAHTAIRNLPIGWYVFAPRDTGMYWMTGSQVAMWSRLMFGSYVERGLRTDPIWIDDGEIMYYLPTGGSFSLERVEPRGPLGEPFKV